MTTERSIQRAGLVAMGMAVALVLVWTTSSWRASASLQPDESTLVPVIPARILDTRDPVNLGLDGPFVSPVSQDLRVTGQVATADGMRTVVPEGATGVVLNVTVVEPTARGFVSVRPSGTPGAPTTSNLNFEAGEVAPNAVSVQLPTSGPSAGRIQITYDAYGVPGPFADILVDVVAYTSSTGIADLAARVSALESQVTAVNETVTVIEQNNGDAAEAIAALESQMATKQDACADGAVIAWGRTIAEPGEEWVQLIGEHSCTGVPLQVRQVDAVDPSAEGLYELRMPGYLLDPTTIQATTVGGTPRVASVLGDVTPAANVQVEVINSATSDKAFDAFQVVVMSATPAP